MEEKNRKNPFWNAKLTSEERLDWLLANMTLEEKITCMASTMPELPRFGIDMSYVGGEAAHGVEARNDQNGRNIPEPTTSFPQPMLIYGKEATTQIENSVPYYSVSSGAVTRKCCCSIFMPLK